MLRPSLLLVAIAACSPAPAPVATAANDPSNPRAAEGTPVARVAEGPDAGQGYVCPMHPEVTSSTPGSCPKCHMKLVPKQ